MQFTENQIFWTDMVRCVEKYVQSCPQCQMRKVTRKPTSGFLQPLPVYGPFHTVAMDLLGSFPKRREGNRYIAVVTDALTKFSVADPLADAFAAAVAKFYVRRSNSNLVPPRSF